MAGVGPRVGCGGQWRPLDGPGGQGAGAQTADVRCGGQWRPLDGPRDQGAGAQTADVRCGGLERRAAAGGAGVEAEDSRTAR